MIHAPIGWQVPHTVGGSTSLFYDFRNKKTTYTIIKNVGDNPYNERGFYYYGSLGYGCYYWPDIKKEATKAAPVEGVIFIPASGYIKMTNGALEYDGEDGWADHHTYLRSNSSNSGVNSYVYLAHQGREITLNFNTGKRVGTPVRCIKSPEIPAGQ